MVTGVTTEAIAGEKMIVTAGGVDTHVHYICPQANPSPTPNPNPSPNPNPNPSQARVRILPQLQGGEARVSLFLFDPLSGDKLGRAPAWLEALERPLMPMEAG